MVERFEKKCSDRVKTACCTLNITSEKRTAIKKAVTYMESKEDSVGYFHEEFDPFRSWIQKEGYIDLLYKTPIGEKPIVEMSKSEIWTDLTYILENDDDLDGRMRNFYIENGTVKQLLKRLLELIDEKSGKQEWTGFKRSFDSSKISKLTGEKEELFKLLKADVSNGKVFPAVRKDELHFYYAGGCLYSFDGISFTRGEYEQERYSANTSGLQPYEKAKQQNINKNTNKEGLVTERQLLDSLNCHTFGEDCSKVVVLDVEIRLNGETGGAKKCDMVLLNTDTKQIMFVEGKVFSDERVNVKAGFIPKVIEQVNTYTAAIREQAQVIVEQYCEHIRIINEIFSTEYSAPISLIPTAKLLVYETPEQLRLNGLYSVNEINESLGVNNVAWYKKGEKPTVDEIWDALCK